MRGAEKHATVSENECFYFPISVTAPCEMGALPQLPETTMHVLLRLLIAAIAIVLLACAAVEVGLLPHFGENPTLPPLATNQ